MIGTVVTGSGKASEWQLENPDVLENLRVRYGWDRVEPGSLNVKHPRWFHRPGVVQPPMECTLEGRPVIIVKITGGCVEVMGPEHYRTALDLTDGDEVTLVTDDPRAEAWGC